MDTFLFAVRAVAPIVLPVLLGWGLRRVGLFTEEFCRVGNKVTFRVLLPVLLFHNVYGIGALADVDLGFVLFTVAGTVILSLVALLPTALLFKQNTQRSVLVQAVFRSNFAIIGIPLATSLGGAEGAAAASILSAFTIFTYNILAVILLAAYAPEEENVSLGRRLPKILLGIVKNPLIIGIFCGVLTLAGRALFVRAGIGFRLTEIASLSSVVRSLASAATPFALLMLGGNFTFSAVRSLRRQIVYGVVLRCAVVPAVMLPIAYRLMPDLGAGTWGALIAAFGTPAAVSSAVMAREMGADGELAGQLVVWTSIFSAVTVFVSVALFRAAGIF